MKYIDDIKINKRISKIGLGCGRLGSTYTDELSMNLLDVFYEGGGTLLDTARSYSPWEENGRGKSETCIGRWMQKRGNRDDIVIVTKGGIVNNKINNTRENLDRELAESLEALQTDYTDIFLIHKDDKARPIEELAETVSYLGDKYDIRRLGFSNIDYSRLKEYDECVRKNRMERPVYIENCWSVADYKFEMWNDEYCVGMGGELYRYMLENHMTCLAYSSQCKGYFQKYVKSGSEGIDDFLKTRVETERNLKKALYIKEYCQREAVSPTEVVLGYITSNELRGIALVSPSNMDQEKEILKGSDYVLPQKVIGEIDSL